MADNKLKLLVPWLRKKLDENIFTNFRWLNRRKTIFQIPWAHKASNKWDDVDIAVPMAWAVYKGASEEEKKDLKKIKTRFRCAMYSRKKELVELTERRNKRFRYWMMLNTRTDKVPKKAKKTKKRKTKTKASAVKELKRANETETSPMELSPPISLRQTLDGNNSPNLNCDIFAAASNVSFQTSDVSVQTDGEIAEQANDIDALTNQSEQLPSFDIFYHNASPSQLSDSNILPQPQGNLTDTFTALDDISFNEITDFTSSQNLLQYNNCTPQVAEQECSININFTTLPQYQDEGFHELSDFEFFEMAFRFDDLFLNGIDTSLQLRST